MKRGKWARSKNWRFLISLVILLLIETSALSATVWNVPSRDYPTIQSAINKAVSGDEVVVAPGTYTGSGNVDLDFKGKAITLRSQINPGSPNWNIIAATVINCGGGKYTPHRAFRFHTHEGSNSKILGFTIKNGYSRGSIGASGAFGAPTPAPYESINPTDPNGTPRAERGTVSPVSNGYGGAILCESASSPTIQYCVITNCTVTGGQGGDGADGQSGTWSYQPPYDVNDPNAVVPSLVNVPDGQWGGSGANGYGNGYGGAIACMSGSSPLISDCIVKDNIARGGCGGDGGAGGNAVSSPANASPANYSGGNGSFGGNAGNSYGDGIGGGIYSENSSAPNIVNCTFNNNIATTGARAPGGVAGRGTAIAPPTGPATNGADGLVFSFGNIAGGAAYYNHPSTANFTNCKFTGNKAYEAYIFYDPLYAYFLGEDILAYTKGGALYSGSSNTVTINTCDFIDNAGGAVYCDTGCTLTINTSDPSRKCLFTGNSNLSGSGGAVCVSSTGSANIQNCTFGGNSAQNDGGALECASNIILKNCSFSGNIANSGYGGATDIYRYQSPTPLTIDINNCNFSKNQAQIGGGFSSENFTATFANCYFIGNTAERSGGLDLWYGNISITNSIINNNITTDGDGGGFNCQSTATQILNCTIMNNLAGNITSIGGSGGAIHFEGAPTCRIFNCLITGNAAAVDGGAIYCYNAAPEIKNCTFDGDFANGFGGAIFSGWGSLPQIINCIFQECSNHAIHEEDNGGNANATYCLFYSNTGGDYYDSGTGFVYTGSTGTHPVSSIPISSPGSNNNLYGYPRFTPGVLGDYYLSQIAAGQSNNSPAVNSGSGSAASLGLDKYTTRTDNVGDAGQVDRGYHFRKSSEVGAFHLTANVVGGHGSVSISPARDVYYAGTVVTLTVTPDTGWLFKAWTGTDNDDSINLTNTVVMYADRTVTVEFRQPRTLIVSAGGGQGYYSTIQNAVLDAGKGDTVVVYAGTYYSGYPYSRALMVDRPILITSRNPEDPCCVAATIIDGLLGTNGFTNVGVGFVSNSTGAVLNGFTIQNCGGFIDNALNGDRNAGHPNGDDGGSGEGFAIYVAQEVGPTIKNCVIRNNQIIGGNGGDGAGAITTANAGRGGWGGWAHGGAIYCAPSSSPTFINCRIINNRAIGGNGGNGGNATGTSSANYGGNWSRAGSLGALVYDIDPLSLNMNLIVDGSPLWEHWQWDYADIYLPMYGNPSGTSYFGDYRWYSGLGGGAYCDVNSTVTFIDCQISGNIAQGGMSGRGGLTTGGRPLEPLIPYEIPSFGGGAYCAAGATVTFTSCTIANNIASPPVLADANFPNLGLRFRLDPYLGHGGGVCAEDTANVIFNNCTFSDNGASVGGAFNWANANPTISDCSFTSNTAFQGGGLFGEHGRGTISNCSITNNKAVPASDPNTYEEVLSTGGGIHCWATDVNIIGCNINNNHAETSGGGVYFGGESAPSVINCLITDNLAGRDGGGISVNTFVDVNVANCTISGNVGGKFGGGLYCSYSSFAHIIDSIIWGNFAANGPQIAIGSGDPYSPQPSVVEVAYSDIGPRHSITVFGVEKIAQASSLGVAQVIESQTIENNIQSSGWANIIISLNEPLELKKATSWDSPASVAALQTEINIRQQAVLSTLTSGEFQLRYRCNNVTTFSGKVTSAGLSKLIDNPQVKFIEPVRYANVMMRQGLALTNSMGIRSTYSGSGVAVAIVDTGVDYRHPKLGGGGFPNSKVIGGYDFGMMDFDPMPVGVAHGTCCAGIAAGDLANVGDYIGGVAYNAKIYALKASADNANFFAWDAILASWDWCISNKNLKSYPIVAISNSLGGEVFSTKAAADAAYPSLAAAAATAVEAGITVFAASGNDGARNAISVPAALSNVISVGAVYDTTDRVIGYSNTAAILDMLAPSDPTYTTDIIGAGGYAPGDYDPTFNGTSAACPFAAGSALIIQSAAKQNSGHYLTPEQVKIILTASGNAITDTKATITKSRVNLGAAIDSMFGSPIYIEQGSSIKNNWWHATNNTWDPCSHNLDVNSDPLFTQGRLDNYYLSQTAAGQRINSPAVDAGSTSAILAGMGGLSTRTDNVNDSGRVDMGFHHNDAVTISDYKLTTFVDPVGQGTIDPPAGVDHFYPQFWQVALTAQASDSMHRFKAWHGTDDDTKKEINPADGEPCSIQHNIVTMDSDKQVTAEFETKYVSLTVSVVGGNGSVTWSPLPDSPPNLYLRGKVVNLTAHPNEGYKVKRWIGTDNDASVATTNTVTMYNDTTVSVEFKHPATLTVPGNYTSIQEALDAAEDGDTVLVAPATYTTSTGYLIYNKNVTISSVAPDDPCVVARTVIKQGIGGGGYVDVSAFTFANVGPETVLNGITISGFVNQAYSGLPGDALGVSGENGEHAFGGGIVCAMASPTIKNCVITDCSAIAGNGGNGFNGSGNSLTDPNINGTDGGWPGRAYGGGLGCFINSNPVVINCIFRNCSAIGGNGGDGGNGSTTRDIYGVGGRGGGWYYGTDSRWYNVTWRNSSQGYQRYGPDTNSFYDFYTDYTGCGGAVFVGENCFPTFTHCAFINSSTEGGTCGITGLDGYPPVNRVEPSIHWKIDNFGGAVFCETNSSPIFTDCNFIGNTADTDYPSNNDDPYVSYGGAIAWETGANVTLKNCTFSDNLAAAGGAIYGANADAQITDCNIFDNLAYKGGGLFETSGSSIIGNCIFQNNFARTAPNNVGGQGGGIYNASMITKIFDCRISGNDANTSGGGIYFTGIDGLPIVTNCLITSNFAGRDGGGISANWKSDVNIANCTIANNVVTKFGFEKGYGGGLYCSYENYTNIVNSIIWGNSAQNGSQLAVSTGFEYSKLPSTADVSYSDVQGGEPNVFVDQGCTLNWGDGNILTNPLFATGPFGNYFLSQIAAGQSVNSNCVDKGNITAQEAGMYRHTTRTDLVLENLDSPVDLGYHYTNLRTIELVGDLNFDGVVDEQDLFRLMHFWLNDCEFPDWCQGADLNKDGIVNFYDFAIMINYFGLHETTPPVPNPMTWEAMPASRPGVTWAKMTATKAADAYGGQIDYYFQRTNDVCVPDGFYRDWDPNRSFTNTGLVIGRTYGYRVKARDARHNETGWSMIGFVTAGKGSPPNAPSNLAATVISASQINLTWTDTSDNETGFKIQRKTGTGSFTRIATVAANVNDYNNISLTAGTAYTYRVIAYNTDGNSLPSNEASATTQSGGNQPVVPDVVGMTQANASAAITAVSGLVVGTTTQQYSDTVAVGIVISQSPVSGTTVDTGSAVNIVVSSGKPVMLSGTSDPNSTQTKEGDPSYWYHTVVASIPNLGGGQTVWFRFVCNTASGFSSRWISSAETFPLTLTNPFSSTYPSVVVTLSGTTVTYKIAVKPGSSFGWSLGWHVCASFNADGSNSSCSAVLTIPTH